jgi:hypothetical protein
MRWMLWVFVVGCGSGTPAVPTPVDAACVAKADAVDGAEDHVGHKCPNCSLHMDGKPEFASTVNGTVFHSCSTGCKGYLEADPGKVLARACASL